MYFKYLFYISIYYIMWIVLLVLNLIIVIYTFLTNLFCCFTLEIARIKMSPDYCSSWEALNTQQYVRDICDICSSWLFCCKQNRIPVMVHEKCHVYLSIVLLFSYSCCITVTLCCYSDLCNIIFPPLRKSKLLLIIYLTYILYM